MGHLKNIICLLGLCLCLLGEVQAQLVQYGDDINDIFFYGGHLDKSKFKSRDSLLRYDGAKQCLAFMQKHYPNKKFPHIYLDIITTKDHFVREWKDITEYKLAYDDLNGWYYQCEESERGDDRSYLPLGILIRIHALNPQKEEILKLLSYGLAHQKELKKIYRKAFKSHKSLEGEDLPNGLPPEKIKEILSQPLKD